MSDGALYDRFLRPRVKEALADTPVVLIHGPRQSGKSTLARQIGEEQGYTYRTFDDDVSREFAAADPVGFVADLPDRVILDEVQRVPEIFTSVKRVVDEDRRPGRFLMTGSANILFLPKLADSLSGRIEIERLHPLAQSEIVGRVPSFLEDLVAGKIGSRYSGVRLGRILADRIVAGGYPVALTRTDHRRTAWYRDYVETIVQRDVQDLARIHSLDALPRLLEAAASNTARLLNLSDLAAPFKLTRPTIGNYTTLLSRLFLLEQLPAWHTNRLSRLVKSPKLHMSDTGLACALLDIGADDLWEDRALYGQMLETFLYQELRRQSSWHQQPMRFYHFRDKEKNEVDIVLEAGRKIAGIEIKASATVSRRDFAGLERLRDAAGERFSMGVLLYDGEESLGFGDRMRAVPISAVWGE